MRGEARVTPRTARRTKPGVGVSGVPAEGGAGVRGKARVTPRTARRAKPGVGVSGVPAEGGAGVRGEAPSRNETRQGRRRLWRAVE